MSVYAHDNLEADFKALSKGIEAVTMAAINARETLRSSSESATRADTAIEHQTGRTSVAGFKYATNGFVADEAGSVASLASLIFKGQDVSQGAAPGLSPVSSRASILNQELINSPAGSKNGNGTGATVLRAITGWLSSGLTFSPLLKPLMGLFGDGDEQQLDPLTQYALPETIRRQASASQGLWEAYDYDQTGKIRTYGRRSDTLTSGKPESITVNVQAMDARSFLDHSTEIASAVREAMLNLNSINDVISDL